MRARDVRPAVLLEAEKEHRVPAPGLDRETPTVAPRAVAELVPHAPQPLRHRGEGLSLRERGLPALLGLVQEHEDGGDSSSAVRGREPVLVVLVLLPVVVLEELELLLVLVADLAEVLHPALDAVEDVVVLLGEESPKRGANVVEHPGVVLASHHGRALQVRRADLDEVVALLRGEETVVEERLGLVRQLLHVRIADADVIGVQRTGVVSHPALVRRHDLRRAVARVRSARVWPRHLPEPADEALLLGADDLGADATRESRRNRQRQ